MPFTPTRQAKVSKYEKNQILRNNSCLTRLLSQLMSLPSGRGM